MQTIHDGFMRNLESLDTFIKNLSPVVKKHDVEIMEKVERLIEKLLKIVGVSKRDLKKKSEIAIKITPSKLHKKQIDQILKTVVDTAGLLRIPPSNVELLFKSSFVMLMSYFDFLISDLIHFYYRTYPESLSGKDLSITLNELKLCNDVPEGVDYIVSKEVEKVLFKSLDDQKKYFEGFLKIDCKTKIINWDKINEAMERRNIVVHNDSIINRRYLGNVNLSGIQEGPKDLKEGQKIAIAPNYFATIFDEIFIAGVILIQCCWRKWEKEHVKIADVQLNQCIYNKLEKEKWTVAEQLGLFSKECEVSDDSSRLALNINYAQSLKWQNKNEELQKELKGLDISTLSPKYLLAVFALRDDKSNFYKNLKKAIIADEMSLYDFLNWPLFKEFRKDFGYEKRIRAAFSSIPKKRKT